MLWAWVGIRRTSWLSPEKSDPDAGVQRVLWKNRCSAVRVTYEPPPGIPATVGHGG